MIENVSFFEIAAACLEFLSWQVFYSTIVLCGVLLILRFSPRKNPAIALSILALVLIRLVLPIDFSLDYSARYFFDAVIAIGESEAADNSQLRGLPAHEHLAHSHLNPSLTSSLSLPGESGFFYRYPMLTWLLFGAWLLGVCLTATLFAVRWWSFRKQVRSAKLVNTPQILDIVNRWRKQFRVRRPVRLVASDRYLSPFTMGVFRPVIFFPESLLNSRDWQTLEPIIAHEMVHLRHFDALWVRLQNLLQIVYFFHPVVWLVARRINEARESFCDIAVLASGNITRRQYTNSILTVLRMNLTGMPGLQTQPGFGHYNHQLTKRLQHINKGGVFMKRPSRLGMLFMLMAFGYFLLPMSSACSQAGEGNASEPVAAEMPKQSEQPEKEEPPTTESAESSADLEFVSPIAKGYSTSEFGMRVHPISKKKQLHRGIDIAAPMGTPVYAASSGVVRFADVNGGYGNMINIEHALGYITRYGQLSEIMVKEGQKVKRGDLIAKVGSSGMSTGPHLHFEIYPGEGKQPVDPRDLIFDLPGKKSHK